MKPSFGLKQLCPDNNTQTVTADKTAAIPPQRRTRAPTGNTLSEQGSAGEFWVCQRGEAGCGHVINLSVKNDSLRKIALLLNCCIVK